MLHLVDRSRTVELGGSAQARPLVTIVRYPARGAARDVDINGAPPARESGPFPLIVFGHGFAVTPALYARLLRAWTRAGFVVAAPVFPLENADAPGGPDESDLPNQPADMSFVITRLLALSATRGSALAGLIDPTRIAVAGQSDGGDTALSVAYDPRHRDPRVEAAIILSGAALPGVGGPSFSRDEPPLLAVQGTADTVNPPALTQAFFAAARPPKYLLSVLGGEHLPPYSQQGPQLEAVARVSVAFLRAYLERQPGAASALRSSGNIAGISALLADP